MSNTPALYSDRLTQLRENLTAQNLSGFLIPMADEYQNEYVSAHDKRIEFLTGFRGSSAYMIVLEDKAIFFTDGRYTLQAAKQLPKDLYTIIDVADKVPSKWISENLAKKSNLGFDPRLHTAKQIETLETIALKKSISLIPVSDNLVDLIWEDQPQKPSEAIQAHPKEYAGETSLDKRRKICEKLIEKKTDACILTDPASIAWLLNIRGNDVEKTPLPLSTLILHNDKSVQWFVSPSKVTTELNKNLDKKIKQHAPDDFEIELKKLGTKQASVSIDPNLTSFFVANTLSKAGANIIKSEDPCILPRACKNKTEIKGMIAAHERDAVALIRFLAWLDNQVETNQPVTELGADEILTNFRSEGANYKGLSFSTIAGSGPNGAIVHYSASKETNRTFHKGEFLLIDSGAQYLDGTTDVTRTIPIGPISEEMIDRFTRVLKGHIALAKVRFPSGISGSNLDILARQNLWEIGLDFSHGTGHGVGSYLCVHEGPQNISRRGDTALCAGMVLSNEPGYYKEGQYGIRHENLQYVVKIESISTDTQTMFGFRPLTLAPFDKRAIDASMLSANEKAWLNEYHTYVYETVSPQLDEKTRTWLANATTNL